MSVLYHLSCIISRKKSCEEKKPPLFQAAVSALDSCEIIFRVKLSLILPFDCSGDKAVLNLFAQEQIQNQRRECSQNQCSTDGTPVGRVLA